MANTRHSLSTSTNIFCILSKYNTEWKKRQEILKINENLGVKTRS